MTNNIDIEGLAVGHLKTLFSKIGCLRAVINDNDKEPIWDGYIYVYEYNTKQRSNEDLKGRIPIQVKGHIEKDIYSGNNKIPSYKFDVTNLKNYLNDGGVLFFVVTFDENGENERVFYKRLLPFDLKRILKQVKGNKTKTLQLEYLPDNKIKIINLLLNYINDSKRQGSIIESDYVDLERLMNDKKNLELTFGYTALGTPDDDAFDYMFSNGMYIYAKLDCGIFIPVEYADKVEKIETIKNLVVKVNDEIYYNKARIAFLPEKNIEISISKSITITYFYKTLKQRLDFKICGSISERINDIKFLLAATKNNGFYFDNQFFDFTKSDKGLLTDVEFLAMEKTVTELQKIKKLLDKLGIDDELNLDKMTKQDYKNLELLNSTILGEKPIELILEDTLIGVITICNLRIFVCTIKDKTTGKIRIYDYWNSPVTIKEINKITGEEEILPLFVGLSSNDLLIISNLNEEKIIKYIDAINLSEIKIEKIIFFLLNLLKAFDKSAGTKMNLLNLAKKIIVILKDKNNNNEINLKYLRLNELQIIKRERHLTEEERFEIYEMIKSNEDDNALLTGAYLLLDKINEAERAFNNLNEVQKKNFMEYPICKFWTK